MEKVCNMSNVEVASGLSTSSSSWKSEFGAIGWFCWDNGSTGSFADFTRGEAGGCGASVPTLGGGGGADIGADGNFAAFACIGCFGAALGLTKGPLKESITSKVGAEGPMALGATATGGRGGPRGD